MPSSEPLEMTIETFSILPLSAMTRLPCRLSDTATGFGDAGDLRRQLGWSLREQLVELLDADAGGPAQRPHGRPGALLRVLVAHELEDLPVLLGQRVDAGRVGDLGRHVVPPLVGIGEES